VFVAFSLADKKIEQPSARYEVLALMQKQLAVFYFILKQGKSFVPIY